MLYCGTNALLQYKTSSGSCHTWIREVEQCSPETSRCICPILTVARLTRCVHAWLNRQHLEHRTGRNQTRQYLLKGHTTDSFHFTARRYFSRFHHVVTDPLVHFASWPFWCRLDGVSVSHCSTKTSLMTEQIRDQNSKRSLTFNTTRSWKTPGGHREPTVTDSPSALARLTSDKFMWLKETCLKAAALKRGRNKLQDMSAVASEGTEKLMQIQYAKVLLFAHEQTPTIKHYSTTWRLSDASEKHKSIRFGFPAALSLPASIFRWQTYRSAINQ